MAVPSWPSTLPAVPLTDGTGIESLYQEPIETEMEDGPSRRRPRSTAVWAAITQRYRMTKGQFATFQVFVRDTLGQGSARFTIPVWKPGATLPLPEKTVKLAGPPTIQQVGDRVFVGLPLKVLDY